MNDPITSTVTSCPWCGRVVHRRESGKLAHHTGPIDSREPCKGSGKPKHRP